MFRIWFNVVIISFCMTISAQDKPLKYYADLLGKNIGVAFHESYVNGGGGDHNTVVKREFNTIVCENAMKAQSITQSKSSYNFSTADQVVNFAISNNLKVRGHTLIWHGQNAAWITTGSRQAVLENMNYHINKMMEHFKGKCFQWDVVNEAYEDEGGNLRNSAFKSTVGPDFIDSAFVFAHRADPDCKLFYNDFNTETVNVKSDSVYAMVKRMLAKGIPISGVGFQSHEPGWAGKFGCSSYADLKKNFERFAALGLEIAITELDVQGAAQDTVYANYMRVTLEMPAVTTYMIWGVRDQDSWRSSGSPLLFNNSYQPKKDYTTILELLKNPPVAAILPVSHIKSALQSGGLMYNSTANTIIFNNKSSDNPVKLEAFDLLGAKLWSHTIPANKVISLSTFNNVTGLRFLRVKDQMLSVNFIGNQGAQ
jgi:GH35 family endo-1,4-beta-xylanase